MKTVKMTGREVNVEYTYIGEVDAKRVQSGLSTEEQIEGLLTGELFDSIAGCYDFQVSVDEEVIDLVALEDGIVDQSLSIPELGKWGIARIEFSKRCEYKIEVFEPDFDAKRLYLSAEHLRIGDEIYTAYSLNYADQEAEFIESLTEDLQFILIDPEGVAHEVNIDEDARSV